MSMRKRPAVMEHRTSDVVDPPIVDVTPRGGDIERAPVEPAVGGNGFTNHATAWDALAGQGELISDLRDFLKEIDENPDLRSAATLRTLSRIRAELDRIPETCQMGDPVVLKVQDVVLVMRQLMSRLR